MDEKIKTSSNRRSFSKIDLVKKGSSLYISKYSDTSGQSTKPLLPDNVVQVLQLIALVVILTTTVVLFSLPITFHYISVRERER